MNNLSEMELVDFLDEWTRPQRESALGLQGWWGHENSKSAYQEIRRIIHKYFQEAGVKIKEKP